MRRCDLNENDWVERYQWLQTLLNTKEDIRAEFRVWKMALSARLPAFSLATRGVVRRTCWPKHSLVKPLSPSPQLNLHLGPRYATRISIANTLSIALKHYLTGDLTSMDYWILTSVLFLGWFAIWMCTSFWDLKSPGLDLITVIIVLRFMSFFSIIYWPF